MWLSVSVLCLFPLCLVFYSWSNQALFILPSFPLTFTLNLRCNPCSTSAVLCLINLVLVSSYWDLFSALWNSWSEIQIYPETHFFFWPVRFFFLLLCISRTSDDHFPSLFCLHFSSLFPRWPLWAACSWCQLPDGGLLILTISQWLLSFLAFSAWWF